MRRLVGPVVLCLAALLLGGCSGGGASSDSAAPAVSEGRADSGSVDGPVDGDSAASDVDLAAADQAADRQVVTTGTVTLTVGDPADAAQRASEIVDSAGGRVDARVEQSATGEQEANAHLVVRIPAEGLTETLEALKGLGEVERVDLTATDVTDAAKDLDARISALTVSVGRLESLMGAATSSDDLLALESALSTRQSDLEAMQAQRAGLAGQVSLATVTLDLLATGTVVAGGPDGFWGGVVAGWGALVAALGGAAIAAGVLLPWVVFLGLLAAGILATVRIIRTRRSPPPATAPHPTGSANSP